MKIKLGGVRMENYDLTLERKGDALIVNGEVFNFARVENGDELPYEAILSSKNGSLFAGSITRVNGELLIPFTLPYGPNASPEQMFPKAITVSADGMITLPNALLEVEIPPLLEVFGNE